MRKRSVNHIADTIFWYAVYMLPLILTIIQSIAIFGGAGYVGWQQLFNDNLTALGCSSGLIVDTLRAIFGTSGVMPLFNVDTLFMFGQWFVGSLLLHLCVDFILFIPRIAHKWLDDFVKKER